MNNKIKAAQNLLKQFIRSPKRKKIVPTLVSGLQTVFLPVTGYCFLTQIE